MERYLLFDAGCLACSTLARSIAQETQQWLTTRSLRDPEMQQLLAQAKPEWRWEPTLLEVEGSDIRVYTNLSLRMKLLTGLGPHKAWHIAQLTHQSIKQGNKPVGARRKFLQQAGLVAGGLAVTLGLENMMPGHQAHAASTVSGPGNYTLLQADNTAVTALKQSPDVLAATTQFGEIDWTTASQISSNGRTGYMIFFKSAAGAASSETTYLITEEPVTGQMVRSLVGRTLVGNQSKVEQWYTVTGQHLGTIQFASSGEATAVVNNAISGAVDPNLNIGCLINCLSVNRAASCGGVCQICIPGIPPTCLACIVCGGIVAFNCVKECW